MQMRNNRRHTSSGPNDKGMLAETREKTGVFGESRGFRIIHDSISGPRNEDFAVFDSE